MIIKTAGVLLLPVALFMCYPLQSQATRELHGVVAFDTALIPTVPHDYRLRLSKGESVALVVQQIGVDVVVEVRDPRGRMSSIDSPNGRNGPELVEIIADEGGLYSLRVRAFDGREPVGKYHLQINVWRNPAETAALLRGRELARDSASDWLKPRSAAIPASGIVINNGPLPPLDSIARRARVIGLGEATHGSREFNDFRISASRRLIERNGYRVVAIEASIARLEILNKYVRGEIGAGPMVTRALESGWIGRRAQRELIAWLRQWNGAHPTAKVSLIGLDPQDNSIARDSLNAFVSRAYGSELTARLAPMFREFAAADSQTLVFGNSNIDSASRAASMELLSRLELDASVLTSRFGSAVVEANRHAARQLVEFAEFNSSGGGSLNRSRDYFMALNLLEALEKIGPTSKAVFWAHNSHVAHPPGRSANSRTSGAWLREWLGCDYSALGASFGEGAFVAQRPNDPTDRLAISQLPPSPPESIDTVLAKVRSGASIVSWNCRIDSAAVPAWLRRPHPMHWVGGLFTPGSNPSEAFRSFDLLKDFDGAYYLPRVTADEMPTDRPLIPGRSRQ